MTTEINKTTKTQDDHKDIQKKPQYDHKESQNNNKDTK